MYYVCTYIVSCNSTVILNEVMRLFTPEVMRLKLHGFMQDGDFWRRPRKDNKSGKALFGRLNIIRFGHGAAENGENSTPKVLFYFLYAERHKGEFANGSKRDEKSLLLFMRNLYDRVSVSTCSYLRVYDWYVCDFLKTIIHPTTTWFQTDLITKNTWYTSHCIHT